MNLQIRPTVPEDKDFIMSFVLRFSNFDLSAWRTVGEVNEANCR